MLIYSTYLKVADSEKEYRDPYFRRLISYGWKRYKSQYRYNKKLIESIDSFGARTFWSLTLEFPDYTLAKNLKYDRIKLIIHRFKNMPEKVFNKNDFILYPNDIQYKEYKYSFDLDISELEEDTFVYTMDKYLNKCEKLEKKKKEESDE